MSVLLDIPSFAAAAHIELEMASASIPAAVRIFPPTTPAAAAIKRYCRTTNGCSTTDPPLCRPSTSFSAGYSSSTAGFQMFWSSGVSSHHSSIALKPSLERLFLRSSSQQIHYHCSTYFQRSCTPYRQKSCPNFRASVSCSTAMGNGGSKRVWAEPARDSKLLPSEELWLRVKEAAVSSTHHPFVFGVIAGTLPVPCALSYLRDSYAASKQDAAVPEFEKIASISPILALQRVLQNDFADFSRQIESEAPMDTEVGEYGKSGSDNRNEFEIISTVFRIISEKIIFIRLWLVIIQAVSSLNLDSKTLQTHSYGALVSPFTIQSLKNQLTELEEYLNSLVRKKTVMFERNGLGKLSTIEQEIDEVEEVEYENKFGKELDSFSELLVSLEKDYTCFIEKERVLMDKHCPQEMSSCHPLALTKEDFLTTASGHRKTVPVFVTDFDATCTYEDASGTLIDVAMAAVTRKMGMENDKVMAESPFVTDLSRSKKLADMDGNGEGGIIVSEELTASYMANKWEALILSYYEVQGSVLDEILFTSDGERQQASDFEQEQVLLEKMSKIYFANLGTVALQKKSSKMAFSGMERSAIENQVESQRQGPVAVRETTFGGLDPLLQPLIDQLSPLRNCELCLSLPPPLPSVPLLWLPADLTNCTYEKGVTGLNEELFNGLFFAHSFNPVGLNMALRHLAKVEKVTNRAVMDSRVLEGSTRAEIWAAAPENKLRPNCAKVLERVATNGWPVHILSANWSKDLIGGTLTAATAVGTGNRGRFHVHSNDLEFDDRGYSTGNICRAVETAFDKGRILDDLHHLTHVFPVLDTKESCLKMSGGCFSVYLGDSITDLLAMLAADLGIVIGNSQNLRRLCKAYGVEIRPLLVASSAMAALKPRGKNWSGRGSGVIYEASGWEEVEACLLGR